MTAPEDWARDSPLLAYRQRHQYGDEQVRKMIERHFRVPEARVAAVAAAGGDVAAGGAAQPRLRRLPVPPQLQQARCYEAAFDVAQDALDGSEHNGHLLAT